MCRRGRRHCLLTRWPLFQNKNLDWFPRMRAMSLVSNEGEGEQNEIRILQDKLSSTMKLVSHLTAQLNELKEQVCTQRAPPPAPPPRPALRPLGSLACRGGSRCWGLHVPHVPPSWVWGRRRVPNTLPSVES